MKTRCKFYVTSIELIGGCIYNQETKAYDQKEMAKVHFNAVKSDDPDTENHSFWKASPSGKMDLTLSLESAEPFKRGTFWYIDEYPLTQPWKDGQVNAFEDKQFEPNRSVWKLTLMERWHESSLRVQLRQTDGDGLFEVTIDNKNAWPVYTGLGDCYVLGILPAEK